MSYVIQRATSSYPLLFLMVDSGDHLTGKTGITPTVTLSKAGAAFAVPAGAVSEVGNGWYKVAGNAVDTNTLGPLLLHATGSGADATDVYYEVVAYNPQSAGALNITVTQPDLDSECFSVTQGDDYYTTEGRALQFDITTSIDLSAATAKLFIYDGVTESSSVAMEITCSITAISGGYRATAQLSAVETAAILNTQQKYRLRFTLTNGHVLTLYRGFIKASS